MQIEFNGNVVPTQAGTIAEFLAEQGIKPTAVAVALDSAFIPRARHASEPLTDGARLEVLSPMQGG